ncbi:MAG: response regulator [Spirochaetaceae bacterium]|jgi:DNA-binding response OmpR family regulator|nr:response regulator [Spirochaetaceae bacterium]
MKNLYKDEHKSASILIADNEELNLEFFDLMLTKLGFKVEKAEDGHIALEKIRQKNIDFALINTILPKVSGWEILKAIKTDPHLEHVQVILISDIDNLKERVECYELGGESYISKPFNFSVILAKIRQAMRAKHFYIEFGKKLAGGNHGA